MGWSEDAAHTTSTDPEDDIVFAEVEWGSLCLVLFELREFGSSLKVRKRLQVPDLRVQDRSPGLIRHLDFTQNLHKAESA